MKIAFFILIWFLAFSTEANEPLFKNTTIQQSCKSDNFYNSYIRFDSNGENHVAIQSSQIVINTSLKIKGNNIFLYFKSTKDLGRGGMNIPWGEISRKKEILSLTTLDESKGIYIIQWNGLYNIKTKKYLLESLFQINDPKFRACRLDEEGEWENYINSQKKLESNPEPKEPELEPQNKTTTPEPAEVAKQELVTTPPDNTKVIQAKKAEPIKKSASGSFSLTFLASLLGLLAWRTS